MGIEHQGAPGSRHQELAVNDGISLRFQNLRPDTPGLHHGLDQRGVFSDICAVRGDIGKGQKTEVFLDDIQLMGASVPAHALGYGLPAFKNSARNRQDAEPKNERRCKSSDHTNILP